MSVCRVFYCAQDSKGLQVLARARKDCASVFLTALVAPLSTAVVDQSPKSVGSEACKKFLFKGTCICEELSSQNILHTHA